MPAPGASGAQRAIGIQQREILQRRERLKGDQTIWLS
jgi:hypothetical protein